MAYYRRPLADCTCPREIRPLGRFEGVDMGKGMVRLRTTKDCPEHDSCHSFTKELRSSHDNGSWLYCPIHKRRDCP